MTTGIAYSLPIKVEGDTAVMVSRLQWSNGWQVDTQRFNYVDDSWWLVSTGVFDSFLEALAEADRIFAEYAPEVVVIEGVM